MELSTIFLSFFWGFCASFCCAVLFNTGKFGIFWASLLGGLGWMSYTFVSFYSASVSAGYLCGAFCVGLCAEFLAFIVKNPATVFLIPGLIPLVPGGGMFQTMRAAVTGQGELALEIGYTTLIAAGAIALGIALSSSVARTISLIARRKHKYPTGND